METAVRKATRLEYRPPKEKHLQTLKNLTFENPASIDGILMNLEKRLKERSWIITYKVLVILHYLMREGNCAQVVDAMIKRPSVLDASRIKNKSHTPANVQNIYLYRAYLDERVIAFRHLRRDYVAASSSKEEGRLRHLLVKDGLLKETAALQRQMESVLKCKFYLDEKDPQITWFAYRMVIEDLLALFQAVNEGVVNILEHYFEMNKADATTALNIYKTFAQQTELTIAYLNDARKLENDIQLAIPPIKHAPLSLAAALEEYLNDGSAEQVDISQAKPLSLAIQSSDQRSSTVSQLASQQPPFQPSMQQPMQQQQVYTQPQVQNDPFSIQQQQQQATMDAAFSTVNRQSSFSLPRQRPQGLEISPQASSPMQAPNPFLTTMSQSPINANFNSPFATISAQSTSSPYAATATARSSTFSPAMGHVNDSNPFRSMSMSSPQRYTTSLSSMNFSSPTEQPPQQIMVAKPVPYQAFQQPQATGNNPFSPVTPPLTPNRPLNVFMGPQQQQQQQPLAPSNPFMALQSQQQNTLNTANANYQHSSAF
ncbi:translation elongation factor EF-1 alpha [Mucor velutinosus]|uniref:Translation elongation factor EF-1 alpha n=1 Tax=Mucor velutinosus TaxID=708070 RepID=A0AAN7D7P6_9FUNG|nr:translation elongation factor EF-1 alpha [Mucor velutinosus]